jgi:hypothetical protein
MALHQAVLRCKVTAHVAAYPTAAPPRSAAPGRPCCTVSPWKETLGLGGRALAELHPKQLTASMLVLALERMLKEAEVLPWSGPGPRIRPPPSASPTSAPALPAANAHTAPIGIGALSPGEPSTFIVQLLAAGGT